MSGKPLGDTARLEAALAHLCETIESRVGADPGTSYTASLLARGPLQCAKKLGEEAVELALALAAQDDSDVAGEAADLLYHLMVALRSRGISLDEVAQALATRQSMSGLEEKARRHD